MGGQTALTKNSPKFASLRLTLPISIVKQWGLKEGDRLDWSWKVLDGKMVLVADKSNSSASPPYNNNKDRRTTSSSEQDQQLPKQPKQLQQHDNKKQNTYNQFMKLASRAAYRATKI